MVTQTQTAHEPAPIPTQADPVQYDETMLSRAWARAALDLREATASSLLDFVPQVDSRLIRPYHLAPLASAIERTRTEPVRMTISVPPRMGKTQLILLGIIWLLLGDPSTLIAYISYAAGVARTKSRLARDYARNVGIIPRPDADALSEWILPTGGGVRAGGIGGPLTGNGFRTIFVDDPTKNRAEAESRVYRQRNWEWFTSTATTRLTPGGSIVVCHTRWHSDDLIGRLRKETDKFIRTRGQEGEWWEHINLPAIDDEPRVDGARPTGLALCPELWTRKQLLKKRRAVGEYDWSALYQGNPRPRGAKLFRDPARYAGLPSRHGKTIVIGVDVAGTASTRSNFTVATVMGFMGKGDGLMADVLEVKRWQVEIPDVARKLQALQVKYGGAPLIIEGSGLGKAVPQLLLDVNRKLRITVVYPVTDKWVRAQSYAAAWNDQRIRLPESPGPEELEYIRVHTEFTGVNDVEDDDVDAGAHAFNFMRGKVHFAPIGGGGGESDTLRETTI